MLLLRRNFSAVIVIWLGIITFIIDRYTKHLVLANFELSQAWNPFPEFFSYFRLVYWANTGAAFGAFQGGNNILILLAILVCGAILYYSFRTPLEDLSLRVALGLQLGGALGNLIDRVLYGHAVVFISFLSFPIFNVADLCITMGVLSLFYNTWRQESSLRVRNTIRSE
jgi:signal peptidase II